MHSPKTCLKPFILLDGGGIRLGPTPFQFENMRLKSEGFKKLFKSWWQNLNFCGSGATSLRLSLKPLRLAKILEQGGVW